VATYAPTDLDATASGAQEERKQMIYPLYYRNRLRLLWGGVDSPLYRKHCRIVARGALNARLVEFEDGTRHVVSGNSLRRRKA
jgi:hypothetical protein